MCFIPFGLDSMITLNCLHAIPLSSTLGGEIVKDELQKCYSTEGTACKIAMFVWFLRS